MKHEKKVVEIFLAPKATPSSKKKRNDQKELNINKVDDQKEFFDHPP